ncbi:hypothetical protein DTW90_06755 [Neorhizobium sp. P12A]|jgi:hypothetical protein|uniref:hypothetical protein n=1 Tax=Rhizobium/Agrobacterium group TaxID=227290 RepID=UPI0010483D94|nr:MULTISPECIES: hypothetical protein [Rhizobium/Agrobacterium group]KAA0699132.1 hypothetical protein DTW90_06755 [Neorhizobium sp. P12A]TCR90654.1 hypothetical protein EV561_10343 [Rhizobium sp. BK376]
MRFLLRFASLVALVAATIAGTLDSIQSVAASAVVMTPMQDALQDLSPSALTTLQSAVSYYIHPSLYNQVIEWVMSQPAFAVLLTISLLLWMIAYKKPPASGRFAA